eukprot:3940994-Rhodomonas_salina.2
MSEPDIAPSTTPHTRRKIAEFTRKARRADRALLERPGSTMLRQYRTACSTFVARCTGTLVPHARSTIVQY